MLPFAPLSLGGHCSHSEGERSILTAHLLLLSQVLAYLRPRPLPASAIANVIILPLRIRVSRPHCPLITSVRTSPCVAAQGWLNARSCSFALPVSLSADYALLLSEGTAAPSLLVPGAGAAAAAAAAMAAAAFQKCADDDSGPRITGVKKGRDVLLS